MKVKLYKKEMIMEKKEMFLNTNIFGFEDVESEILSKIKGSTVGLKMESENKGKRYNLITANYVIDKIIDNNITNEKIAEFYKFYRENQIFKEFFIEGQKNKINYPDTFCFEDATYSEKIDSYFLDCIHNKVFKVERSIRAKWKMSEFYHTRQDIQDKRCFCYLTICEMLRKYNINMGYPISFVSSFYKVRRLDRYLKSLGLESKGFTNLNNIKNELKLIGKEFTKANILDEIREKNIIGDERANIIRLFQKQNISNASLNEVDENQQEMEINELVKDNHSSLLQYILKSKLTDQEQLLMTLLHLEKPTPTVEVIEERYGHSYNTYKKDEKEILKKLEQYFN